MEAGSGLVAGSHNRNELVVIRREGESGPKPLQQLSGQICQICGENVGLTIDGDLFVACNECAFPICRTCYEYERKEGNQVCLQCETRFKRLKGCARVAGDEEEDDIDDPENEFNFMGRDQHDVQYDAEDVLLERGEREAGQERERVVGRRVRRRIATSYPVSPHFSNGSIQPLDLIQWLFAVGAPSVWDARYH